MDPGRAPTLARPSLPHHTGHIRQCGGWRLCIVEPDRVACLAPPMPPRVARAAASAPFHALASRGAACVGPDRPPAPVQKRRALQSSADIAHFDFLAGRAVLPALLGVAIRTRPPNRCKTCPDI